jgi:hypothetical protein
VVITWGTGEGSTTLNLGAGVLTYTASHQYLDDNPTNTTSDSYSIGVTVTDDDSGSATGSTSVTVNNVAPTTVSATPSPATINEGGTTTVGGSFVDPGTQDTHKVTVTWGDGTPNTVVDLAAGVLTFGGLTHTYVDDNPTGTTSDAYSISVTVKDDDNGTGSGTSSVTVNNVAPTITGFTGTTSFAGPLVFMPSTFTTTFTDPGTDTFRAEFTWGDGSPVQSVAPFHSGDKVDHLYLTAICGRTVTVKVIDDDTGSVQATTTVNIGTGGFLAPMTNQPVTNKLKNGQVLPVKIQLTDCTGAGVTGLTPAIRLVAGDQTSVFDDTSTTITPPSVSGADTDGWMRPSNPNGTYIYNMQVNIPLNTDYTVVIYPMATPTPLNLNGGYTLRHVIQATK